MVNGNYVPVLRRPEQVRTPRDEPPRQVVPRFFFCKRKVSVLYGQTGGQDLGRPKHLPFSFCSILHSRVLTRAPRLSYFGGGEGERSRVCLLSVKSLSSSLRDASTKRKYRATTSGSSESAGVGPPSAAPMPCVNP